MAWRFRPLLWQFYWPPEEALDNANGTLRFRGTPIEKQPQALRQVKTSKQS